MNVYIKEGEWSRFVVRRTTAGWAVEFQSRVQGCWSGRKVLVRPGPSRGLPHFVDLESDWNEWTTAGDYIAWLAAECPDRIIRTGWRIQ